MRPEKLWWCDIVKCRRVGLLFLVKAFLASNLADADAVQQPELQRLLLPSEKGCCMESPELGNAEYQEEILRDADGVPHKS